MRDPRRELASASAARLSGDDYQHLFTLMQAVRLLREDVWGVSKVMMEVDKAGNVDDLIIYYRDKPTLYNQVKFSRLAGQPLEHGWFTDPAGASRSPLQRFHGSFIDLSHGDVPARMALVTNRTIAPGDPILRHVEGRDGLLTPRLANASANSESGKKRAAWAKHLRIAEEELLEMLDHLHIQSGIGSLEQLQDACAQAMLAAGLRGDQQAVMIGNGAIRDLIEGGCDHLDKAAMRELVEHHDLVGAAAVAQLCIAAIDRPPFADSATYLLDWTDRYEGAEPRQRRRLLDVSGAPLQMSSELTEARHALEGAGYRDISVTGAFRLDIGFSVGAEFSDTAGFHLTVKQRDQGWTSNGEVEPFAVEAMEQDAVGGEELAICISISNEISEEVATFVDSAGLPIGRILILAPASGPGRTSLATAAEARGCAQALLDSLRAHASGATRLHLFLSCPNGLAVLLGHVWNRLPPTRVYADLNPGYQATF